MSQMQEQLLLSKQIWCHLTYLLVQYCVWRERKMELV